MKDCAEIATAVCGGPRIFYTQSGSVWVSCFLYTHMVLKNVRSPCGTCVELQLRHRSYKGRRLYNCGTGIHPSLLAVTYRYRTDYTFFQHMGADIFCCDCDRVTIVQCLFSVWRIDKKGYTPPICGQKGVGNFAPARALLVQQYPLLSIGPPPTAQ